MFRNVNDLFTNPQSGEKMTRERKAKKKNPSLHLILARTAVSKDVLTILRFQNCVFKNRTSCEALWKQGKEPAE